MTLGSPMVLLDQRDSTAEASTYPPLRTVLMSAGFLKSASIFRRRRPT
jgi:hypothetical protein